METSDFGTLYYVGRITSIGVLVNSAMPCNINMTTALESYKHDINDGITSTSTVTAYI